MLCGLFLVAVTATASVAHKGQLLVFRCDGAVVATARRLMQAIGLRGVRARRTKEVAA